MTDDHMILPLLDDANRMSFSHFLHYIRDNEELGGILSNASGRFRPFFMAMYGLQALVFGDNIHLWYTVNFLLFSASIVLMLLSFKHVFGGVLSLFASAAVLTFLQWHWMFRDTGLSEIYCVIGISSLVYIVITNFSNNNISLTTYTLLTLAHFVAIGSKEPFLCIAILPLGFLLRCCILQKHKVLAFAATGLNSLMFTYVSFGILRTLHLRGADFYGKSISLQGVLSSLPEYITDYIEISRLGIFLPLAIVVYFLHKMLSRQTLTAPEQLSDRATFVGITVCILLIGFAQYVFYHGDIRNQHYSIIFSAIPVLMWLTLAWLFLKAFTSMPSASLTPLSKASVLFLLCYFITSTPSASRCILQIYHDNSHSYFKALQELSLLLKNHPNKPLVLCTGNTNELERILSPAIYLKKYFHVSNDITLMVEGMAPNLRSQRSVTNPASQELSEKGFLDITLPWKSGYSTNSIRAGVFIDTNPTGCYLGGLQPHEVPVRTVLIVLDK